MNDIIIKNGGIPQNVTNAIIALTEEIQNLTAELDGIKAKLFAEMEANNIAKIDTENLLITYVPATTRESLDSRKLRDEMPEVYDAYCKISEVKASLRIKIR